MMVAPKVTVCPGCTLTGVATTELIAKVWARAGAASVIKASNMAKTTISVKRGTYRPTAQGSRRRQVMQRLLALSSNWAATGDPSAMQTLLYKISSNPPPGSSAYELIGYLNLCVARHRTTSADLADHVLTAG